MRKPVLNILVCLALAGFTNHLAAQELNCEVVVNHSQIQGTGTQVFTTLENALKEFINNRKWTDAIYDTRERIRCSMNIQVKEYSDDGRFVCELIVQSVRPVWQSSYQSPVFSFRDTEVNFNYLEYDPLELRENTIDNNLTAVIAYYAYMIIGLDMDTMSPQGGTALFRKAGNIVSMAQTMSEKGWRAFDSTRNRYALVTDYLEEEMRPFRQFLYEYHKEGMDEFTINPSRARANITRFLPALLAATRNNPMSLWAQLFTEAKKNELVNIYSEATQREKEEVYDILSKTNPSLNSDWNKIKM